MCHHLLQDRLFALFGPRGERKMFETLVFVVFCCGNVAYAFSVYITCLFCLFLFSSSVLPYKFPNAMTSWEILAFFAHVGVWLLSALALFELFWLIYFIFSSSVLGMLALLSSCFASLFLLLLLIAVLVLLLSLMVLRDCCVSSTYVAGLLLLSFGFSVLSSERGTRRQTNLVLTLSWMLWPPHLTQPFQIIFGLSFFPLSWVQALLLTRVTRASSWTDFCLSSFLIFVCYFSVSFFLFLLILSRFLFSSRVPSSCSFCCQFGSCSTVLLVCRLVFVNVLLHPFGLF